MRTQVKRSFRRNLKAVSPVIATIIIVAIAIVMSIAVAYWMLGLGASFTRFEKLEFTSGYAIINSTQRTINTFNTTTFDIKVTLKNSGSADATLDLVFLNGIPSGDYGGSNSTVIVTWAGATTLKPGDSVSGVISLPKDLIGTSWKSGMNVDLMIQSVKGNLYPKTIVLP